MIDLLNGYFAFPIREEYCAVLNAESLDIFKYNGKINELLEELDPKSPHQNGEICLHSDARSPDGVLSSVTLCVSERCNLACKYCYADAGTYGKARRKNMTFEDMKRMFDKLIEVYPRGVKGITFFGGEPMLAFSQIEKFVSYVCSITKKSTLCTPLFAIVTNGTLIDDHAWSVFNEYSFNVTVSLDGPKDLNDTMRVYVKSDASVYDDVKKNLVNREKRSFPLVAEATLTLDFFRSYISGNAESYMQSFFDLGFDSVSPFLAESKETDWRNPVINQKISIFYKDLTDYCFSKLLLSADDCLRVPSFILKPIISILKKQKRTGCSAGKESLFYVSTGDIYPCQMYYGTSSCAIGNIDELEELQQTIRDKKRLKCEDVAGCKSCFSRGFCSLWCPGGAFLFTGVETNVNPARCLIQKAIAERVVCGLVDIFKSTNADRFIRNLQLLSSRYSRSTFFEL